MYYRRMNYFGEIFEPTSRVAWEDWDYDEVLNDSNIINSSDLKWQNEFQFPETFCNNHFYLIEGKYLIESLKLQTHLKLELINSVSKIKLNLYKINNTNNIVCAVQDYNIIESSAIVELLRPLIMGSEMVVTVVTKPLAEYQTAEPIDQSCVIKTVTTTKRNNFIDYNLTKLEQPNIISGVSAGVISLREHLDKPGVAIVCYMEYLQDYQNEDVQKLFVTLNILDSINSHLTGDLDSNLYT